MPSRFVLADPVTANGEPGFLGRVHHQAAAAGVRGVVSFADPWRRRVAATSRMVDLVLPHVPETDR